jgi:integrase
MSLETRDIAIAREQVAVVLPHVYALKRLCRRMAELTPEEFKRAVTHEVTRIVETLERTREPWRRVSNPWQQPANGMGNGLGLSGLSSAATFRMVDTGLGTVMTNVDGTSPSKVFAELQRMKIQRGDHTAGITQTRQVLAALGIHVTEDSQLFRELSLEMMKLDVMVEHVRHARANGDYKTEDEFIEHYRRLGYLLPTAAAPSGPKLTDAWNEYAAEKTGAKPNPVWTVKTAAGQEAMFSEFKEIVGNIHVSQVVRDVMLRYRNTIARLPKNRTKHYPGKTIAELLEMEIPADRLPAGRTVQEKLVQIGAFLKWCRETKQYLTVDPMTGVHFDAESRSYAPFTRSDLEKLFNSNEFQKNEHSKSWHFWVPLVALYTGARQAEIAQLEVRDVLQEDGVWILAITDVGDDQRIKTKAGRRKVPISSKLVGLGFLDYVAYAKDRGEQRLFPDIPRGKHGWGDKVSRWFNYTYKKNCGIEDDVTGNRKVFHSFRHTAITKATKTPALFTLAQQVFGHEKSLLGETGTYIHPYEASELVPVIESLDWGLDHSAYKDSWRRYVERW